MKTLDEIREEVQESDRREFDKRVAGVRKKVYDAIESFGMTPGVDYEEGLWDIRTCILLCIQHQYSLPLNQYQCVLLHSVQGMVCI